MEISEYYVDRIRRLTAASGPRRPPCAIPFLARPVLLGCAAMPSLLGTMVATARPKLKAACVRVVPS